MVCEPLGLSGCGCPLGRCWRFHLLFQFPGRGRAPATQLSDNSGVCLVGEGVAQKVLKPSLVGWGKGVLEHAPFQLSLGRGA